MILEGRIKGQHKSALRGFLIYSHLARLPLTELPRLASRIPSSPLSLRLSIHHLTPSRARSITDLPRNQTSRSEVSALSLHKLV